MNKPLALLFACVGVFLLLGIAFSISYQQPLWVLACSIASILFIGLGFVVKAKLRKRM